MFLALRLNLEVQLIMIESLGESRGFVGGGAFVRMMLSVFLICVGLMAIIRLVTSDVFQGDAIGNFSLQLRDFFEQNGIPCHLYARYYDAAAGLGIRDFDLLFDEIEPDDILFAQFSIYERGNERYRELPNKKIAYYHGITPPEYFYDIDPQTEVNCAKGRQQYHCFEGFDYYLANSRFMLNEFLVGVSGGESTVLAELESRSSVLPPTLKPLQWQGIESEVLGGDVGQHSVLCVGRLAPHKKIEDVIDWFTVYLKLEPRASLVVVGGDAPPAYGDSVRKKVADLGIELSSRVRFVGRVTSGQLKYLYESSAALITLSEHEGFCVPLLEAMYFNLPIFARGAAAIPETLGCSEGLLERQSLEVFAGECHQLLAGGAVDELQLRQSSALNALVGRCDGVLLLDIIDHLSSAE